MKKVQLKIQGEEVYPQTSSDRVLMQNNKTLKEELSDFNRDEYTSTQTVASSMEKVLEGMLTGPYHSCKMYGRTLKSLFTRSFTLNPKQQYSQISGHHNDVQIEVGKEYTVIIDVYKNNSNCSLGFKTYGCTITPRDGLGFQGREIGRKVAMVVFTTKKFGRWFWFETNIADENATEPIECELTVVDGDYRDTRLDHFGGLCDVKNPILKNVGKNLFNYNDVSQGSIIWNTPNNVNIFQDVWYEELTYGFRLKECIKVKPNTRYYTNFPYNMHVMKYRVNGDLIKNQWSGVDTGYFITTSDTHYINLYPSGGINANLWNEERRQLFRECFIYEEDAISTYENYKTNILETSNDVVLRGLPNGVKDSYDCLTGEYVQRVGEATITDTTPKSIAVLDNNIRVNISLPQLNCVNGTTKANNTLSSDFNWSEANARDIEGMRVNGNTFHWCISKNKLRTHDLQGVNTYLSEKPLTFQYELAEPIVTTIEPSTTPFAYENGHIILESGCEGQSLLPTLEYSASCSKGQVIQSTSETIIKHENRLSYLEQLALRESVLIGYNYLLDKYQTLITDTEQGDVDEIRSVEK